MAIRFRTSATTSAGAMQKLGFNADAAAIVIALTLAALIRLNLLPRVGW